MQHKWETFVLAYCECLLREDAVQTADRTASAMRRRGIHGSTELRTSASMAGFCACLLHTLSVCLFSSPLSSQPSIRYVASLIKSPQVGQLTKHENYSNHLIITRQNLDICEQNLEFCEHYCSKFIRKKVTPSYGNPNVRRLV